MSKQNNFLGVEEFKLGTPGDGVMGASLTNFPDVEVGSVNLEGSTPNEETIATEGNDTYLTVNGDATPAQVTARLLGVDPADYPLLMGGTTTSGIWNAPKTPPNIYLSLQIKGKANGGKQGLLQMAYAKVSAKVQGTITKNGLPAIDITLMANTPVAADGTEGSPYSLGYEDVV